MARFREDARFKAVGPPEGVWEEDEGEGELVFGLTAEEREEMWFDWSFAEFWKNNYCSSEPSFFLLQTRTDPTLGPALTCRHDPALDQL
jgi:hypothetical protein